MPPAEEQEDTTSKETVAGKESSESVPVSTSGPVSEEKVQSALAAVPNPKTDDTDEGPKSDEKGKETGAKDSADVGGAEAGPIAGEGEKPAPSKTVEEVAKEKEGGAGGESKEEFKAEKIEELEKQKEEEKKVPVANGPDEEGESAEAQAGEKRGAVNGGKEEGPTKKAKTAAPTTNGGAAKGKGKREKKQPAPVGKTERRTRSQGLA